MNESEYKQSIVDSFFEHSYHDRGMLKWQGFYLSDHTTALNKEKIQREKKIEYRSQQTLEEISKVLLEAYTKNKTVEIQLNKLDQNDNPKPVIRTKIKGYNDDNIFIKNERFISIEDIRNIKIYRWSGIYETDKKIINECKIKLRIDKYINELNKVEKDTLFYKAQQIFYTFLTIVPFTMFAFWGLHIKTAFIFQFFTFVISVYLIYKLISYKNPPKKRSKKIFIIIQLSLTILFCSIFLIKYLLKMDVFQNIGVLKHIPNKQIGDLLIIYIDLWAIFLSILDLKFMIYNIFPDTIKNKIKLIIKESLLILSAVISILSFGELKTSNIVIVTIIYAFIGAQLTPKTFYILAFPEVNNLLKKFLTTIQYNKMILRNFYISTIISTFTIEKHLDKWATEKWFKTLQIPYKKGDMLLTGLYKLIVFAIFFVILTILFKIVISYIRDNKMKIFY